MQPTNHREAGAARLLTAHPAFHRMIVIGASAGGVTAVHELVSQLPADLAAAIFLVIHTSGSRDSRLPDVLSRAGTLPVRYAQDGAPIRPGRIYLAPPGRHLLVERGLMRVVKGVEENFMRPAIDPLFRTAAVCYQRRVIGVLLSGVLYDGTAGLLAVKMHGGTTIVQDPEEAIFPDLCRTAAKYVDIDYQLTLSKMAGLLPRLAAHPASWRPLSAVS